MLNKLTKVTNYHLVFFDQIIVSLCNFLITILILRFLGVQYFGYFSFLWIFLLLINSLQLSYIISPMLSNGPKISKNEIELFYGSVFNQQIIFTIILFLFTYFTLKYFGNSLSNYELKTFYLSFSLTIVTTQIYQFLRRLLFSKQLFIKAIISDLFVYFGIIFLIIILNIKNYLDLNILIWCFVIMFLIGILFNLNLFLSLKFSLQKTRDFYLKNWIISKWLLLTSITQWFSGNLWIINAGIILGPYIFGVIRACQTILNMVNVFFQSFENIIPSNTSRIYSTEGVLSMKNYLRLFTYKGLISVLFILLIIFFFSEYILIIFYGSEIANYSNILIFLSFVILINFFHFVPIYGLRTLEKTRPIFISYLISSIFALVLSDYVISKFDMKGFIMGLYFSQIIILIFLYYSYQSVLKKFIK